MNTAISYTPHEDTTGINIVSENYMYLYGSERTDHSSINNPILLLRSPRNPVTVIYSNNRIEEIKQIFNGTVIEYNELELTARLEDITNPDNPDEMVTLSLDEIENGDQSLIQPGAMFLWHIGYRTGTNYPRERFSKIKFRRLAKWTEDETQDVKKLAREYANYFLGTH